MVSYEDVFPRVQFSWLVEWFNELEYNSLESHQNFSEVILETDFPCGMLNSVRLFELQLLTTNYRQLSKNLLVEILESGCNFMYDF